MAACSLTVPEGWTWACLAAPPLPSGGIRPAGVQAARPRLPPHPPANPPCLPAGPRQAAPGRSHVACVPGSPWAQLAWVGFEETFMLPAEPRDISPHPSQS